MDSNYENNNYENNVKEKVRDDDISYRILLVCSIILNIGLVGLCVYNTYRANSLEARTKEQNRYSRNRNVSIRSRLESVKKSVESLDSEISKLEKDTRDSSSDIKTEKKVD